MGNPFVHVELHTQDPERAKKFYKELFDWKLEDVPEMDYTIIKVGEGTGGGIMKSPMPDALPQWVPYVLVDDIAASTGKAKSLGATVLADVTEIPDIGRFSMLLDPTGAAFALFSRKCPHRSRIDKHAGEDRNASQFIGLARARPGMRALGAEGSRK